MYYHTFSAPGIYHIYIITIKDQNVSKKSLISVWGFNLEKTKKKKVRGKGKRRGVLCSPLLSCSTDLRISGTKKSSPFLQLPPNSPFPDLFLTASSGFPELQQLLICLVELQGRRFSCPFQGKIVFIPRWKTAWGHPGHPNHPFCGKAQHGGIPVVNGVPTSWWHTCRTPIPKWRWGWGRCWEGSLPFPHPGSLKYMCCSSQ